MSENQTKKKDGRALERQSKSASAAVFRNTGSIASTITEVIKLGLFCKEIHL